MNGLKNRDKKDLTNCQIFFYFPAGCLGRRRMIGPHAPRPSLPDGGGALVGISWTRPASVLFRTAGDHARMPPLAVCWTGAASVVFRFRGTRPACARHALRPSSSRRRGITPACPASAQALRYYRAGGRANGRHPRRASLFLKF